MKQLFDPDKLIYGSAAWKHQGLVGWNLSETDIPELTAEGRSYMDLFSPRPSRFRNVQMRAFVDDELDIWTATFEPGFDVLQELTRFMPGWICDVVEYDHLATLYIGPPEGEYFWTSKFQRQVLNRLRNWKPGNWQTSRYRRGEHESSAQLAPLQ